MIAPKAHTTAWSIMIRRWTLLLAALAALPMLASCSEARSGSLAPAHVQVAAMPASDGPPGCRKEHPVQFQGISCAGYDYDPPPILYGELYPRR